ncbi:hypothetical protein Q5P01_009793 [Channa striata]|uniref:Uncharacterized protein n=1 Tax=Channa striata TaxID=64152 RepID=A0AA88MWW3_CHASR|nr:hypothetical protein Q5P01_009793 [Channa striata]
MQRHHARTAAARVWTSTVLNSVEIKHGAVNKSYLNCAPRQQENIFGLLSLSCCILTVPEEGLMLTRTLLNPLGHFSHLSQFSCVSTPIGTS